jgi:hypothetical protein
MPKGRPSKFTKEIVQPVLEAIRIGLTETEAVSLQPQIKVNTWFKWKLGNKVLTWHPEKINLIQAVTRARPSFKAWHLRNIHKHAEADWRASAWLIARGWPDEYGRFERISHQGKIQHEVNGSVSVKAEKELRRLPVQVQRDIWLAVGNGRNSENG